MAVPTTPDDREWWTGVQTVMLGQIRRPTPDFVLNLTR
jgi:hypothetical protein